MQRLARVSALSRNFEVTEVNCGDIFIWKHTLLELNKIVQWDGEWLDSKQINLQ